MKKLLSVILVFSLLLPIISSAAAFASSNAITLSVGTVSAKSTQTKEITIPVAVETNAQGFINFQFAVSYDSELFKAVTAKIPDDSILVYAPDARDPETLDKPPLSVFAPENKGEIYVASMGAFSTDKNGVMSNHAFFKMGTLVNLTFKLSDALLNGEIKELEDALSTIEISVDNETTPLMLCYADGSVIPAESISCKSGGITISDCGHPDKIEITSKGNTEQSDDSITSVSFTASFTSSSFFAVGNTQWYVNDSLQEKASGRVFSFTPEKSGTFVIEARNGSVRSNTITVTVTQTAPSTPFVPNTTPTPRPNSNFEYYILNKQVVISKYIGKAKDVIIPSEIDNIEVAKIGDNAFAGRTDIISVSIPEGIDEIMSEAFSGCSSLKEITFPKSLYFIQNNAFENCTSLERVDFLNSFVWFYQEAFANCKKLSSVYCYTETPMALDETTFNGTASDLTIYYLGSFVNYWSPAGETTYMDIPIKPFNIDRILLTSESELSIANGMLFGVTPQTTVAALLANFAGGNMSVVDKNGKVLDIDKTVGTGSRVRLTDGDTVIDELTVVISGDVNGDGNINSRDLAAMQKHILGTAELTGIYINSSDVNADSKINSRDLSALQKIILA
ncbi:MAG: leucine-rich repeat protein [Clostridia bacterium]|nr:leucine-rich repeat protein [Clostridia bacterium]